MVLQCITRVVYGLFTSDWLDWFFLASLGMLMGTFSFCVDYCVHNLRKLHFFILDQLESSGLWAQYFGWTGFALLLILFPAGLCNYVAAQAAGSGIPEMKTLLRGVDIDEYLTVRTLAVKCIGLIMVLSSSLPFGKEGPFVHIASAIATLQSKLFDVFLHTSERNTPGKEMLAAACAVGVSSTYGAPIGGVLFSIEVTSVFFPLRNYWRCFVASISSAIVFRLLVVAFTDASTVIAFSPTSFKAEFPFDILYLIPLCILGSLCGIFAVAFIRLFRRWTLFIRETAWIKRLTSKSPFIYPTFMVLLVTSLNFPSIFGKNFAGGLTPRESAEYLFQNYSWQDVPDNTSLRAGFEKYWSVDKHNLFLPLSLFCINMFWMTALSITMAIPSGAFIPIFVTGAGFGRLFGELVTLLFPNGLFTVNQVPNISPGGYAVVGAAAFAGAVTNAISTSVVMTEMIGQTTYLLPTIIALLTANLVRSKMENSLYDTIICIKRLPYLPPLPSASSSAHKVFVCDIMISNIHFLTNKSTVGEVIQLLRQSPKLKAYPLVEDSESMILVGCVRREELLKLLSLCPERMKKERPSSYLATLGHDDARGNSFPLTKMFHSEHHEKESSLKNTAIRSLLKLHQTTADEEELIALKRWKKETLSLPFNFENVQVDPTPFHLVERTSLYKVHAIFSLLGLNRAYVTKLGRLVGIVSLKELRQAFESVSGKASNA